MTVNLRNIISERYELLSKTIEELEKKTDSFPEGRISVKHDGGRVCYYQSGNKTAEKYLTNKDKKLIGDLIQKAYLKKVLRSAKQESEALEKTLKYYPEVVAEEVYDTLSEDRKKMARSIITGDDQYVKKWQERPYTPKPMSDDIPVYLTMRGERVRSKSEIIIADRLYANGIPYKYECPVLVGDEIFHPDFTILRMSDRKILYHEHCGRMDDPGYAEDMVDRINKYNDEGIIHGDRLFLSFETSEKPLDARVIDNLINKHFR
ncbi:MAG: hypothetical protein IKF09_03500 [Clostridiales bacterium]|nr:hypothetical protein [Clostridiales bacterium]